MKYLPPLLALALLATPAAAHGPAGHGSLTAGLTHPLLGTDHLLAMLTVGLWSGLLGARATLAVPAAFLVTMLAGFALALTGLPLPFVEPMILASVVVLGLLVAASLSLDVRICAALAGLFALFHGYAHGSELGGASALRFAAGFGLSTAALLAAGVLLGRGIGRLDGSGDRGFAARVIGGVMAAAGVALALG